MAESQEIASGYRRVEMRNAEFHTGQIKHVCETKLKIISRDSGEYNGWYIFRNKKVARITVSKGRKFVKPNTYHSMAKQLKLTNSQFDDLLACPLTKALYEQHLSTLPGL